MSSGSVKRVNSNNFDAGINIATSPYTCPKDGIVVHSSWGTNTSFLKVNGVTVSGADYVTRGRAAVTNSFRVNKGDSVEIIVWYEADQCSYTFYGAN